MSDHSPSGIQTLQDEPEEYCIRVATQWGTVFIRFRKKRQHWSKAVWLPDEAADDGYWYESRVYHEERSELLEHEHSVYPMSYHPNSEDHDGGDI